MTSSMLLVLLPIFEVKIGQKVLTSTQKLMRESSRVFG